jgi:hypothetical protein
MCGLNCQDVGFPCSSPTHIHKLEACPVVTTTTTVATARQTSTSTDANSTLDKVIVVFAQQPSSLASNIPLILGLAVPLCIITCAFIVLVVCLLRKKSPDDDDNDDHDEHPIDRYAANNAQPEMVSARQDPATSSFYGTLGVGVSFCCFGV